MNIKQYEPISNDDFEGEHEPLDDEIRQIGFPLLTNENVCHMGAFVLAHIVFRSNGRLLSKCKDIDNAMQLMEAHKVLREMMIEGSKSGFKSVRLCKLLRPWVEVPTIHGEMCSVENGWDAPFIGHAADALWAHICCSYTPLDEQGLRYYTQYCAILQSSGMGKSRAVDEMSKSHFVIPAVLREPNSTGHPPSDQLVYEYFSQMSDQRDTFIRICGFLHALFDEAAAVVQSLDDSTAAGSFREYMTKDMVFKQHGEHRVQFYQKVVGAAKEHASSIYISYFGHNVNPSSADADRLLRSDGFPLRKAFRGLCQIILAQDQSAPPHAKRRRKSAPQPGPLVLVAFDEIHILEKPDNGYFDELRRAIRGLLGEPFLALFLSTSGAAFPVASTPARDVSSRMVRKEDMILPFCDLGFNQLARCLDFSKAIVRLSTVTSLDHLVSFGRPLWNSFQPLPDNIVKFAAYRLLGSYEDSFTQPLSISQQLACLAQRIPIEFLSDTSTSQVSSDQEKEQVRSHLRVLSKVEDALKTIVTTTPSEPILSEAAYFLMTSLFPFSPARALQDILNGFAVNKGGVGELLVALLFIVARDNAVGPADRLGQPRGSRWCLLPDLLSCLFRPSSSDPLVVDVQTSLGWRFSKRSVKQTELDLAKTFKDSKVYFTHFVKAQEQKVLSIEYLFCLMARGAALLCAASQMGIVPFLLEGDEIRRDNIGVIMFQSENDQSFTDDPRDDPLRAMNPRAICDMANVPVIRIFFALAATQPALRLVPHSGRGNVQKRYTAYDFWVAGFSPKVLSPIGADPAAWKGILEASDRWEKTDASYSQGSKKP